MGREPAGQTAIAGLQASPSPLPAPSAPKPPPTALAPGFRFHPTDEELVIYYLKRKVGRKTFRFNAIAEVDIYKSEPWDLADKSSLKSRDKEYYFFSALDKKYGNGARMNRATSQGYWKATGNDRPVSHDSRTVGMKKTLVFHSGRAPDGQRTNWVMHEYRLVEEELEKAGLAAGQDAFVLVRVFHKSNIGPPSGQRYAPFIEEEWEDDKTLVIPGVTNGDELAAAPKTTFGKNERDAYVEGKSHHAFIEGNVHDMHVEEKSIEQNTQSVDKAPVSALHILGTKVLPGCKIERQDDHPIPCGTNQDERMNDHPSPGAEDQHHLSSGVDRPSSTLLRYKRRRQNDCSTSNGHASENSSVLTQDRCSATTAAAAAATISTMTTATTKPMKTRNFLSALVEYSLLESIEPKETAPAPPPPEDDTDRDAALPPSCVKFIQDLQGEIHRLSMERDNLKFEYVSAQAIINALQAKVEMLTQENEDLKKAIGGD